MKELKPREKEIYDFIIDFALKNNYLPSFRDIGDAIGLQSTSSIFGYVDGLRYKGYITQEPGSKRYSVKGLRYVKTNEKLLGEELRKVREGITDEKVLIGYNMAIAICNKYLGESEDKDAVSN